MITRERKFENKVEKSVIDYVLVCQDLLKFLIKMTIDDERIHTLTNYSRRNPTKKIISIDHNILWSKFSIVYNRKPKQIRRQLF